MYSLPITAVGIIVARIYYKPAYDRFDELALSLFLVASIAVLVPYLLRELPRLRKVQVGGTVVELMDLEVDLPKVTQLQGLTDSPDFKRRRDVTVRIDASWEAIRHSRKDQSRGIYLAHVLRPSNLPKQKYDVFIFLSRPKMPELTEVRHAEFYFGRYWGHRVFTVQHREKIGVATSAYGPFLAVCKITFTDGREAWVDRFVDFEMGRIFDELSIPKPPSS
jgi:hypothetical protein